MTFKCDDGISRARVSRKRAQHAGVHALLHRGVTGGLLYAPFKEQPTGDLYVGRFSAARGCVAEW